MGINGTNISSERKKQNTARGFTPTPYNLLMFIASELQVSYEIQI
jgi:hypothetical protein